MNATQKEIRTYLRTYVGARKVRINLYGHVEAQGGSGTWNDAGYEHEYTVDRDGKVQHRPDRKRMVH